MQGGDWLVYYSPRTDFKEGQPLQAFTAIGRIKQARVYSFEMSPDFVPYRRDVDFEPAAETLIKPLQPFLEFTQGPNWGYALRRWVLEISRADFERIAVAMGVRPSVYDSPDARVPHPV